MIKYILKLSVIFFVAFLNVEMQAQTLNLNQFGIEEGLPQSSIYAMVHDSSGNIWLGTMAGVSKYNGLMFENFTIKNGLAENRVVSACLDKAGNIWFGHWAGGISVFNVKHNKFYEVNTGELNIFTNITSIVQDEKGNLWMATNGLGLLKYVISSDSIHKGTFTQFKTENGLPDDAVNALALDKKGAIWIATDAGLVKMGNEGKSFKPVGGLPSRVIKSVFFDSKGIIWIGSLDKGLFRMDPSGNIKVYDTSKGLSNNHVRVIFEDANGTLFIGTNGGGVSKYLAGLEANGYKGPIFQSISIEQGLSSNRVLSMIQDREKNIWIGTALNLNQYFDEQFEIYGDQEGLKNSLIWSVIQDKAGDFWLGTEGGLVKFILGENTNKSTFTNYSNNRGGRLNATALYEDVNGNIWYSDFGNGVASFNPKTLKTVRYTTADGLKSQEVYAIAGDKYGNIWMGTNKGGISVFDIKSQEIKTYTKADGLGSDQVYTIFKDSKGNLWLGSLAGELTMHDGKNFKTFSEKDGYNSKFTVCITEDNNGNMWFGTYGKGIYKYDGKKFKNYTAKDGLSSDSPFMIVGDNNNNLWIGTGLGVDKFNLKDESIKYYGKNDGFLGVEINPNSVCKDKNGNLWFGSIIGVVRYNSSKEKNNVAEPITYIKDPRINFEPALIPEDHALSYYDNHLTFDFVGASLTNPKRVRYQYMLVGLDKDWSPIVKDNYVTYPNIPPGEYTFKVKSCNNDGVWNEHAVTYSFSIRPPFWKTPWFYTLSSIVIIASTFTYVKARERRLREQNIILENKVQERTEEINMQKVELEKKNANITDSIDYAKRIQEAIFVDADQINKLLPQSFILFKPKDIVSGDFYWVHEKDGKVLFAAVDCTGHGVPGAFMSIVGYNLLNHIVKDLGITTPSKILNELDKLVFETLSQEGSSQKVKEVKDGMDIAICVFDRKALTLEYAGAYNPLYHVQVHNGELTEYKADKLPIGKSSIHTDGQFTNYSIPMQKGDMVYLFSDGYADQIGGPKRKKFYYGPFKQLLTDISKLPMEEQKKKLDQNIVNWLGNREQVDDIIVLGVKV